MRLFLRLVEPAQAYRAVCSIWPQVKPWLLLGHVLEIVIRPETRSAEQNALQWPILEAFAKQLKWPVNGEMVTLTADEFKDILTAAFQGETVRLAMGLNGGVVMLGLRTSKMSKRVFSEWIDFLKATAALRGIELPALTVPEPEMAAADR